MPDEIGLMAYSDAMNQMEYWRNYPPQHILMRGYVGYEGAPPSREEDEKRTGLLTAELLKTRQATPVAHLPEVIQQRLKERKKKKDQGEDFIKPFMK